MIKPDVEAEFIFFRPEEGGRSIVPTSGYRPAFRIKSDYLTTGLLQYTRPESPELGERVFGTITFISPEYYPHSLWIGWAYMERLMTG